MEYTKNKIPNDIQEFINKLKNYIDTKIYYYGSIQRYDYFVGKSDIDFSVFTDNTEAMIYKISHYLHINKKKFHKIVWNYKNKFIEGYKVVYRNENPKCRLEITIYDEKYKEYVLEDHRIPIHMPFYICFLLIFLKLLYYNLQIIPASFYTHYKKLIINTFKGSNTHFTYIKK
jgi:hypothetical protein